MGNSVLARHTLSDLVASGAPGVRTAGQLARLAGRIASELAPLPKGSRVVLACHDRYYFAAGLLGLWQAGLVAALPHNGQRETVRALTRHPSVRGLLHDSTDTDGCDVRRFESEGAHDDASYRVTLARSAPAVVAFTSGSTGEPAAHEKTLAQLLDETHALIHCFQLAGRRVVASVPPHHLYGLLFGVLVPLLGGGVLSRHSPLQPGEVLHELEAQGADVLVAVPPHLSALSQALREGAVAARWTSTRVFSSGGPLPGPVDRALRALGVCVTQVLGSTETGGIGHRSSCEAAWEPLPGVNVSVDGDQTLCVASPWSAAEPSARVRTGDRAELVDAGFKHLGRNDQVVKVAGRRVDLGDVESKLRALSGVRDARVLALESSSLRGLELCAVVEGDPETLQVEALKQALSRELDPVTLPRRYRVVSAFPRNAAGKLEKRALLGLFDTWTLTRELLEDGRERMRIPANYGYFRGHFDEMGILPGVAQLEQIALKVARERFPGLGTVARLTRVKFKRPVRPGEELVLSIERKGELQVHFDIRCGDDAAASGIIHFRSKSS
jgi:4-coumarate--CoA ligase (photoactive yellow protein activation family)